MTTFDSAVELEVRPTGLRDARDEIRGFADD